MKLSDLFERDRADLLVLLENGEIGKMLSKEVGKFVTRRKRFWALNVQVVRYLSKFDDAGLWKPVGWLPETLPRMSLRFGRRYQNACLWDLDRDGLKAYPITGVRTTGVNRFKREADLKRDDLLSSDPVRYMLNRQGLIKNLRVCTQHEWLGSLGEICQAEIDRWGPSPLRRRVVAGTIGMCRMTAIYDLNAVLDEIAHLRDRQERSRSGRMSGEVRESGAPRARRESARAGANSSSTSREGVDIARNPGRDI